MTQKNKLGFTLVELVTVISIITLIGVGVGTLAFEGMKLWNITQDQIAAQESARAAVKDVVNEIREMQISDNGSYPIESATGNSLVFFANIDNDPKRERVRYTLQNGILYRGITNSTSDVPPQYNPGTDETETVVAQNIVNTEDMFSYYDDSYNGETDPLPEPIEINNIRLVKIKLLFDYDPSRTPAPLEIETNVALRNLKDNL